MQLRCTRFEHVSIVEERVFIYLKHIMKDGTDTVVYGLRQNSGLGNNWNNHQALYEEKKRNTSFTAVTRIDDTN